MDSLLNLLLNVLNVVTTCRGPALRVVPALDMLSEVLADSDLALEQEQLAGAIRARADGQIDLATCLSQMIQIVQRFDSKRAQLAALEERWNAAAKMLDQLLMVSTLLDCDCARHGHFAFSANTMFNFVQSLAIEPAPGDCGLVLVASVPAHSGEVQVNSDAGLLRRILITYNRETEYPRLSVKIPSTTPNEPRQGTRLNWQQRTSPEDDLNLYDFNHRFLGRIITRRINPPYEIQGHKLTIVFLAPMNVEILVTDVIDSRDELLGRFVKLLRPHPNSSFPEVGA